MINAGFVGIFSVVELLFAAAMSTLWHIVLL